MTVTTSYPGVYIQELPSLVHTITPAPTSIAVFVGYTHPFRDPRVPDGDPAVQLRRLPGEFRRLLLQPVAARLRRPGGLPVLPERGADLLRRGPAGAGVLHLQRVAAAADAAGPGRRRPASNAGGITFTALQPVGVRGRPGRGHPDAGGDLERPADDQPRRHGGHRHLLRDDGRDVPQGPDRRTSRPRCRGSNLVTVALSSPPPTAYPATGSPFSLGYAPAPAAGRRDRHQPLRLRAGVRGLRLAGQGAHLQPAGDARDHRRRRHLRSHRLLRAQAGLLHHGHPFAARRRPGWDVNTIVGDLDRVADVVPGPPGPASTPRSTTRGS